ncbi:MAG: DNA-directed RNA polymerase subunit beta' [Candidatus Doudnabacteria bacterium CG10_big_fil_rev_8_21_14_0_10_42_18]|uniref:DNA-directed RNA polymerase subunit beta' n=1 Tax=Candidatus Doudnabacteria bacterium CG10_big_fil_rev_8_21_14_0_10_42_18 TaxID=1974552 RepID=A0A2H0VAW0_9BACT|nr:MAG: DNA-directed RNA polymerase subunit beta' [Candidatus Doudnabacteria bacterium CG10_big_fil_rev_8_21_14_0_10_42_18]
MITQTENFKGVRLKLASPDTIMNWSHGEVTKPETINYRTQRPEKDGLFDEKIFGPIKDWECYCGKYKRIRYKGIVCDKCGVEVTKASVRRERMGHIKLAVPVTHIWFLRGVPSRLGLILDLGVQDLEKVVYFASYIITSVDEEARLQTVEQIEKEFKAKKKAIEEKYETLIAKGKSTLQKASAKKDADLVAAEIDAEITRLKDAWGKELSALESIRDQAKSELKSIKKLQVISELSYRDLSLKYGPVFSAGIGAEALKGLLEEVNLEELSQELQHAATNSEGQAQKKAIKRLKLIKSLINSGLRPEWMLIGSLPVIPPDLRPMVQLDGGRFAASDLNDLYRRVINRNNRLKKLLEIKAPEVITRNEKRMLQEAVDALIDNSIRHGKEVTASTGQKRKLRSLADMLKGKQGRFRQNLLGKRVDYSGRSVIVVGPRLKLHQCGLPKVMALELFKPFVISKLIAREFAHNVRSANRLIEQGKTEVYDILEEVTKDHYILLNRAPTLHRLGFQAFQPVLIEGKAIQLHPMVCAAFNADFDGDQMAVHVPLTEAAQKEAREIMVSAHNLLKPASGDPVMTPDKDVVVGCYYITKIRDGLKGEGKYFTDTKEAILAYNNGYVNAQAKIKVQTETGEILETSVGRLIFNKIVPAEIGFVNETMDKKKLQGLIRQAYRALGNDKTAEFIDEVKRVGFYYMKKSGLSWGMDDLLLPKEKPELLRLADQEVQQTYQEYSEGLLTEEERKNRVVEIWAEVSEKIAKGVLQTVDEHGSVNYMVSSGARGSFSQITQMSGMKGLVVNPAGDVIELPVKGSFKEGLSVLEYFISTHGSRKGMSDTALRTADAGYLTRRLVDVAQDIVVNAEDCGSEDYIIVSREDSQKMNKAFESRLFGRVAAETVKDKKGKVLIEKNNGINDIQAKQIADSGVEEVKCRSVLKCKLSRGICKLCYGFDLGFNQMVEQGAAVGIVAAQAIGEPGTQLTMRTFHTGGSASVKDITQGLPRVEELFEAREPKGKATVSEVDGQVYISKHNDKEYAIQVQAADVQKDSYNLGKSHSAIRDGSHVDSGEALFIDESNKTIRAENSGIVRIDQGKLSVIYEGDSLVEYFVPASYSPTVKAGDLVTKGQQLTEGNLSPSQIMRLRGVEDAQKYVVREVQDIYVSQGQNIHDKHIEVIVRQMFSKMRMITPGDSEYVEGEIADKAKLDYINEDLKKAGKQPAVAEQLLMGITKVSLNTESFLAAASFQETTRVLIQAAVTGKTDYLRGLKENVIIGKLIPAGTGFSDQIAKDNLTVAQVGVELTKEKI